GRGGHGHHTASAVLAQEAFDLTNNPAAFPDQLSTLGVWQVKGLYTNTGRWWNKDIDQNTQGIVAMDVGVYNTLLGKSYSEMAAVSRTQHKSQGFGSSGSRGEEMEFFEFVKGHHAKKDIFETIDTSWSRVEGGSRVAPVITKLIAEYNEENPSASVPLLLKAKKEISALKDGIWKTRKLEEVNQLIKDCLGLYLEVKADNYFIAPGEEVESTFELVNRSDLPVKVKNISSSVLSYDSVLESALVDNDPLKFKTTKTLQVNTHYSDPYWLQESHSLGLFTVKDKSLIGKPENDPAIQFEIQLELNGELLSYNAPLIYKWTDPVKGELWRPVEVVPAMSLNLSESVVVFSDATPKSVSVLAKSNSDQKLIGDILLDLPKGWRSEPAKQPFGLSNRGDEETISFKVFPSDEETTSTLKAKAIVGGQTLDQSMQIIAYDHFPIQTLLPPAEAKLVRIDLKKAGAVIGYIEGAGDQIPAALRNMGYEVFEMKNEEVTPENLARLDAVVLGVR
ncbi:MAG: LmbE family protein, partial [Cyclobacteriaceae bacterium]